MADHAYHPLVRIVARALRHRCGVGQGDRLLVAVSGGADSVALLRALGHLSRRRRWRLSLAVGHVDHGLRGDSAADAAFVESLAGLLKLPYLRRDLELAADTPNLEAVARQHRYNALADMASEIDAACVATAHHADDQLETLLMAILRGTTLRGLRGIAWQRPLPPPSLTAQASSLKPFQLIRPMLAATHEQALDYLRCLSQPWREDHTNRDLSRTRACLRHEVLPVLRRLRPTAAIKALELAEHARRKIADADDATHEDVFDAGP